MSERTVNIVRELAQSFVSRSTSQGLKGKQRHHDAVTFFVGASLAFNASGDEEAYKHISTITAMLIVPRGYSEVERLAQGV